MIHRVGQRFAPGVRNKRGKPFRKSLLESSLQRMIVRYTQVLQNLDVAVESDTRQGTRSGDGRASLGIKAQQPLVEISESGQLCPFVPNICDVQKQISNQLMFDAEIPLLHISCTL